MHVASPATEFLSERNIIKPEVRILSVTVMLTVVKSDVALFIQTTTSLGDDNKSVVEDKIDDAIG